MEYLWSIFEGRTNLKKETPLLSALKTKCLKTKRRGCVESILCDLLNV